MRVLVFVETFMSPTLTFVYNELIALSKEHTVRVLATRRVSEDEFPFPDVVVIPYEIKAIRKKIRWELEKRDVRLDRSDPGFAAKLNDQIKEFKPDIIHGHFGYESIILLDNLFPTKIPIFITFHGYDASSMLQKGCYVRNLNMNFQRFNITPLCVSQNMILDLKLAGVNVSRAKINQCGIDTKWFEPRRKAVEKEKITFLQIASFAEKKGQAFTLKAFRKFLDSRKDPHRFKLVLAGGLYLLENTKKISEELGLKDFVEFVGPVNHTEAYVLLEHANIFVHHSIVAPNGDREGIPTSIMEAMAMELPVLSTWHSGIPELVEDGVNGYLVKEKDIEAYAARMNDIINWDLLPANRRKICEIYSNEVHIHKLINYYEEALSLQALPVSRESIN